MAVMARMMHAVMAVGLAFLTVSYAHDARTGPAAWLLYVITFLALGAAVFTMVAESRRGFDDDVTVAAIWVTNTVMLAGFITQMALHRTLVSETAVALQVGTLLLGDRTGRSRRAACRWLGAKSQALVARLARVPA